MKKKKVLITYFSDLSFECQVSNKIAFNHIIDGMENEGRFCTPHSGLNLVYFEDGSSVVLKPLSEIDFNREQYTHIYISEKTFKFADKASIVSRLEQLKIKDCENFDLRKSTLNSFGLKDSKLHIEKL